MSETLKTEKPEKLTLEGVRKVYVSLSDDESLSPEVRLAVSSMLAILMHFLESINAAHE